jgi:DNA-binding MarR family transcriptional regulator
MGAGEAVWRWMPRNCARRGGSIGSDGSLVKKILTRINSRPPMTAQSSSAPMPRLPNSKRSPISGSLSTFERKRLPPLLRRAWYGLNQAFRQRIAHLEITPDQYSILRWLSEGDPEGLTQRAITDLMASDPNTITSTLSRMELAGLISRHPHELDRRAHRVRLQPAGRRSFENAKKIAIDLQEQVLKALPPARRLKFLHELETISDACGMAAERASKRKGQSG